MQFKDYNVYQLIFFRFSPILVTSFKRLHLCFWGYCFVGYSFADYSFVCYSFASYSFDGYVLLCKILLCMLFHWMLLSFAYFFKIYFLAGCSVKSYFVQDYSLKVNRLLVAWLLNYRLLLNQGYSFVDFSFTGYSLIKVTP